MSLLRPIFAGIATGVGLRIGHDIYEKFKAEAKGDRRAEAFNPFRKRTASDDGAKAPVKAQET